MCHCFCKIIFGLLVTCEPTCDIKVVSLCCQFCPQLLKSLQRVQRYFNNKFQTSKECEVCYIAGWKNFFQKLMYVFLAIFNLLSILQILGLDKPKIVCHLDRWHIFFYKTQRNFNKLSQECDQFSKANSITREIGAITLLSVEPCLTMKCKKLSLGI